MPTASDTITLPDVLCEVVTALPCRGAQEVRNYSVDANALLGENESITENWSVACNDPTVTVKPVSVASGVVTFTVSGGVSNHISAIRLFLPLSTGEVRTPILSMMTEPQGLVGTATETKTIGNDGMPGLSAYELAVESGFTGTKEEWLASLTPNAQTKLPTTANPDATLGKAVDAAFAAQKTNEDGTLATITTVVDDNGNVNNKVENDVTFINIVSPGQTTPTKMGFVGYVTLLMQGITASFATLNGRIVNLSRDGETFYGAVTGNVNNATVQDSTTDKITTVQAALSSISSRMVVAQSAPTNLTSAPSAEDFNNLIGILKQAKVLK